MNLTAIHQMTERVAQLMEERLGAKGRGLHKKLGARGRALPRKVRRAVSYLAEIEAMAAAPKIARQADMERIAAAYDIAVRYLQPLGLGARRWSMLRSVAASIAFVLVITAAAVIGFMVRRGTL